MVCRQTTCGSSRGRLSLLLLLIQELLLPAILEIGSTTAGLSSTRPRAELNWWIGHWSTHLSLTTLPYHACCGLVLMITAVRMSARIILIVRWSGGYTCSSTITVIVVHYL